VARGKKRYIYGKTRKDVAKRLTKATADREQGMVFDAENMKLGAYLDAWLATTKDTVRLGTWKQYEMVTRVHIKPTLGKVRLDRLNALQVQNLYQHKLDEGVSARRVRYIHVTIHKALKDAVRWQLVPRNVANTVAPPRQPRQEIRPLAVGQVKTLLTAACGNRLEALYVLAVTTGMRQGELLGLKWEDVDRGTGTLQVRRTVFNGQINPPKTSSGRRIVKLSQTALEALRKHSERRQQGAWVFSSRNGTPVGSWNFIHRSWYPLKEAARLPKATRFHDLRHTAATLLLLKGVNPKIVSSMLGHANISTTLDIYSHVLPNMQDGAAGAMDDTLS
jgi:integrase